MDQVVVSVLLPVYNAAAFIREAIESVLQQTFSFFELIIIDDCSTDDTVSIIEAIHDSRISFVRKEINSGYTDSLNLGVSIAKGKYVARMDADDICHPKRFETQVTFLDANPSVIICGTYFRILGTEQIITHPQQHEKINVALLDYCAIGHPTVMFRKDLFQIASLSYDREMEPAEDHNLWVRAIRKGQICNIPEVLLDYRMHADQISMIQKEKQQLRSTSAKRYHLSQLYPDLKPGIDIYDIGFPAEQTFAEHLKRFKIYLFELERLVGLNEKYQAFEPRLFIDFCENKKAQIIREWFLHNKNFSLRKARLFLGSKSFYRYFPNSEKQKVLLRAFNPFAW